MVMNEIQVIQCMDILNRSHTELKIEITNTNKSIQLFHNTVVNIYYNAIGKFCSVISDIINMIAVLFMIIMLTFCKLKYLILMSLVLCSIPMIRSQSTPSPTIYISKCKPLQFVQITMDVVILNDVSCPINATDCENQQQQIAYALKAIKGADDGPEINSRVSYIEFDAADAKVFVNLTHYKYNAGQVTNANFSDYFKIIRDSAVCNDLSQRDGNPNLDAAINTTINQFRAANSTNQFRNMQILLFSNCKVNAPENICSKYELDLNSLDNSNQGINVVMVNNGAQFDDKNDNYITCLVKYDNRRILTNSERNVVKYYNKIIPDIKEYICDDPTTAPTSAPTISTTNPTIIPTKYPTLHPSKYPSMGPTIPTYIPTIPSSLPTNAPTYTPTNPTYSPTNPTTSPTVSSISPSMSPTPSPSLTDKYLYVRKSGCDWGHCSSFATNYTNTCVNQVHLIGTAAEYCCPTQSPTFASYPTSNLTACQEASVVARSQHVQTAISFLCNGANSNSANKILIESSLFRSHQSQFGIGHYLVSVENGLQLFDEHGRVIYHDTSFPQYKKPCIASDGYRRIYALGGYNKSTGMAVDKIEVYEFIDDTFINGGFIVTDLDGWVLDKPRYGSMCIYWNVGFIGYIVVVNGMSDLSYEFTDKNKWFKDIRLFRIPRDSNELEYWEEQWGGKTRSDPKSGYQVVLAKNVIDSRLQTLDNYLYLFGGKTHKQSKPFVSRFDLNT
eukprot:256016_1